MSVEPINSQGNRLRKPGTYPVYLAIPRIHDTRLSKSP